MIIRRIANNIWFRWLTLVGWMLVIFAFSSVAHSGEATEKIFGTFNIAIRKAAHVTEYGVLYLLCHNALRRGPRVAFILSLLYALSDEWHQSFVPGRSATLNDVAVDSVGMLIAWLLTSWLSRYRKLASLRN